MSSSIERNILERTRLLLGPFFGFELHHYSIKFSTEDVLNMPEANKVYLEDYEEATRSVRDFLNAHYSSNYDWIFDNIIDEGTEGYVKPRE